MSCLNRVVAIVLPLLMLAPLYSQEVVANEWEVARNEQGIKVSLSEVSGSDYKMFKGETVMLVQSEAVINALTHPDSCNLWRFKCGEFVSLGDGYGYLRNDMPWPINDRFVIIRTIQKDKSTLDITYIPLAELSTEMAQQLPEHDGLIQMAEYSGFWKIDKLAHNRVNVIMQMRVNPAGSVPAALANGGVVDNPFNTLLKLRTYLETLFSGK